MIKKQQQIKTTTNISKYSVELERWQESVRVVLLNSLLLCVPPYLSERPRARDSIYLSICVYTCTHISYYPDKNQLRKVHILLCATPYLSERPRTMDSMYMSIYTGVGVYEHIVVITLTRIGCGKVRFTAVACR